MNIKHLSKLQRVIILMAASDPSRQVLAWQVLHRVYGFPVVRHGRGQRFDRQQIGVARYRAATVAVCKALNRLAGRGLAERIPNEGIYLNKAGLEVCLKLVGLTIGGNGTKSTPKKEGKS